jgi:hypothetical protein
VHPDDRRLGRVEGELALLVALWVLHRPADVPALERVLTDGQPGGFEIDVRRHATFVHELHRISQDRGHRFRASADRSLGGAVRFVIVGKSYCLRDVNGYRVGAL